jgi:hypothetical protein
MLTKDRVWEKWLPGEGADASGFVLVAEVDVGARLVVVDLAFEALDEFEPQAATPTASEQTSARDGIRQARAMWSPIVCGLADPPRQAFRRGVRSSHRCSAATSGHWS